MDMTFTLAQLAGWIALLLWGVHMAQSGIQRAFGPSLRRFLGTALGNRMMAFCAGLGITAVLQSSTATALMVTSFTAGGLVDLVPALAVVLGANVGTTLIVQVMSFDVYAAAPMFVLVGVIMFRRETTRMRDLGRVVIGLGLILLALHQLLIVIEPFEATPNLRVLLESVTVDPVIAMLLAAALTWAIHSSVAVVLLAMSLVAQGVVPLLTGMALVLGANLGTAINPLLELPAGSDAETRRLPVGNFLNRLACCALTLALLDPLGTFLVRLEPDRARAVADFHTAFNLISAILFLPFLGPWAWLLRRLVPARAQPADPARPIDLDEAAREMPAVALAGAAREALRMADVLTARRRERSRRSTGETAGASAKPGAWTTRSIG